MTVENPAMGDFFTALGDSLRERKGHTTITLVAETAVWGGVEGVAKIIEERGGVDQVKTNRFLVTAYEAHKANSYAIAHYPVPEPLKSRVNKLTQRGVQPFSYEEMTELLREDII